MCWQIVCNSSVSNLTKIFLVVIMLSYMDEQADIVKLMGTPLQFLVVNMPKYDYGQWMMIKFLIANISNVYIISVFTCSSNVFLTINAINKRYEIDNNNYSSFSASKPYRHLCFKVHKLKKVSELSSGIYCRVKWLSTDVSEVRTASIIRDEWH
jgi:hypothetical protein